VATLSHASTRVNHKEKKKNPSPVALAALSQAVRWLTKSGLVPCQYLAFGGPRGFDGIQHCVGRC